jgi:hypothetical protein
LLAFAPTVELMRRAKAAGMQVILVSDTYLDAAQLRRLIERAAGPEVIAMVNRIFVSSAYGKNKGQGLYQDVLRKLSVRPYEILHIGDNKHADVGASPLRRQHTAPQTVRQRAGTAIAAGSGQFEHDPPLSGALTAAQPHRATLACTLPQENDPAARLGMSVLGPVLTGFDMWLEEEARKLQAQHEGRVHWLFLMRDGFMPMQVHLARNPDDDAHAIECSRFTAIASSFAQERDITRYLETTLGTDPVALARHFSIPEADIARICPGEIPRPTASPVERDAQGHAQACDRGGITRLCAAAGSAYPQACAPEPGDVLMLVDVGYTGTVQNRVDAILAEAMDVHVAALSGAARNLSFRAGQGRFPRWNAL